MELDLLVFDGHKAIYSAVCRLTNTFAREKLAINTGWLKMNKKIRYLNVFYERIAITESFKKTW